MFPVPSFVCYGPMVTMAGGTPVYLETLEKGNFKLTAERLRRIITPRTKMLILPYPNNPTGAIMTESDLKAVAEVLRDTDIIVLSDEICAELTYGMNATFQSLQLRALRERTTVASGFSKSYAMTGWRLGYSAAPKEITEQMLKIHQYAIMCAPTYCSQYAAIEALSNGDADIAEMTY